MRPLLIAGSHFQLKKSESVTLQSAAITEQLIKDAKMFSMLVLH
jgi:hypothetical protein